VDFTAPDFCEDLIQIGKTPLLKVNTQFFFEQAQVLVSKSCDVIFTVEKDERGVTGLSRKNQTTLVVRKPFALFVIQDVAGGQDLARRLGVQGANKGAANQRQETDETAKNARYDASVINADIELALLSILIFTTKRLTAGHGRRSLYGNH
jgi:hypothetical protein